MTFLLKNPIGSAPNYYKPETGTDKQAGGAGSKTVESDTVQQVDDLGTILVTTFFNVLHDYNIILCFDKCFLFIMGWFVKGCTEFHKFNFTVRIFFT